MLYVQAPLMAQLPLFDDILQRYETTSEIVTQVLAFWTHEACSREHQVR
jgi:hypothetical protein